MINCMAAFQALSCRRLGYSGDILENGLGKIKAAERNDGVKSKTPSSSGGNLGTNLRTRIGDQDSNLQSNQGRNKNRGEKPDEGDDDGFDGEYSDTNKSGRGIEGAGKYLLSGGLAGAVSRTVTAPFDRLKVYLITNQYPKETSTTSAPSTSSPSTSRPLTLSANHRSKLWFTLKLIYNEHSNCNHNLSNPKLPHRTGFRNFFVGNGLNVIKVFPESALKFFVYEYCKSFFSNQIKNNKRSSSEIITTNTNSNEKYYDDDWQANQANDEFGAVEAVEDIGNFNRFIAGGVGGVVSQVVIYPIETLKTRLMSSTSNEKYQGRKLLLDSIKKLNRSRDGIKAYYKGLPVAVLGVFPYSAFDMSVFESLKGFYRNTTGNEAGVVATLLCGAFSGGAGATVVYPLNLVRTRLQAQGTPSHPKIYKNSIECLNYTYRNEGLKGFYKGLTPSMLKVIPAVSISWLVYEYSNRSLDILLS